MASADFTINGSSCPPELAVAALSTVTLALVSTTGVRLIEWSIEGNHSSSAVNPTITPAGSPSGATATFSMPSGAGQGFLVQCKINGGVDETGQEVSNYIKRAIVGVVNAAGIVPFVTGETFERSATHGYTEALNDAIDAGGGGGGGGVTDHGALTGLTDDDHTQYDLSQRPLSAYTSTSNTLVLADNRKHVTTSNASANTLTFPPNSSVAFPVGSWLVGTNIGSATTALTAGVGVTLNGPSLAVPSGYTWFAKKTATDTWYCAVIGAAGGSGGGAGFRFTYSTTTTDADPGAGTFRGNNATLSSVTTLYVDLAEYGGTDVTSWLDSFDDTNGGVKGVLRLQSLSDPTKWIQYVVTAWTTAVGYRKLTVAYLAGPGGLTTTAGDTFLSFDALGYTGTIATANIANVAVTGAKLVAGTAAGQELIWDGSAWYLIGRKTGTALGDASVTVQYTTAAQYIWPAATNTTTNRTITLGTTGLASLPNSGVGAIINVYLLRAGYSNTIAFVNGGSGAGTKFTLTASYSNPVAVSFYYDGTDWNLAGWEDLGTVTAA